jgi:hypothetical protein
MAKRPRSGDDDERGRLEPSARGADGTPRPARPRLSEAQPALAFKRPADGGADAQRPLVYTTDLAARRAPLRTVLVWDLDETLIVFQGLAEGLVGKQTIATLGKVRTLTTGSLAAPRLTRTRVSVSVCMCALGPENRAKHRRCTWASWWRKK